MAAISPVSVKDKKFAGLLTENMFRIPDLQRPFSWGQPQIDDLIDDLLAIVDYMASAETVGEQIQHFFGTIVYLSVPGQSRRSVIDGQQRLTSITVTLALLMHELEALARIAKDELEGPELDAFLTLIRLHQNEVQLHVRSAPDVEGRQAQRLEPSPEISRTYAAIIQGTPLEGVDEHNGPAQSLKFTVTEIREKLICDAERYRSVDLRAKLKHLVNLKQAILHCLVFVEVHTGSPNSAYDLFESLNAKGEPLNTLDLLKVWVMSNLQNHADEKEISTKMRELATPRSKGEDPTKYLAYFYQARLPGKTPNRSGWPNAYALDVRKNLFGDDPIKGISDDERCSAIVAVVRLMHDWFPAYQKLTARPVQYPMTPTGILQQDRINVLLGGTLGHTTSLPLLLAASHVLTAEELFDLVHMVEKVFFRVKVICRRHETLLRSAYNDLIEHLQNGTYSTRAAKSLLGNLVSTHAGDEVFKNSLLTELAYDNGKQSKIKYFLWMLELYSAEFPPRQEVYDVSTLWIEHIHAQAIGDLGVGSDEDVHRLGNLCLLTEEENRALGAKTFAEKKNIVEDWHNGGKSLKSHSARRVFLDHERWDASEMSIREGQVQAEALRAFSL